MNTLKYNFIFLNLVVLGLWNLWTWIECRKKKKNDR